MSYSYSTTNLSRELQDEKNDFLYISMETEDSSIFTIKPQMFKSFRFQQQILFNM